MDRAYLELSVPNIITVTLMWLVGMVLFGFAASLIRQYRSTGTAES